MERTQPNVKAAAVGAGIGGAASPLLQILAYYLTPLVPADIKEPVFRRLGMSITAGLSAAGAWWAGYRAEEV